VDLRSDRPFSQASLQDYVDCPRRFHLRHVVGLRWPAEETAPALENERRLRQGAALHRLIRQHLVGIAAGALSRSIGDSEVQRWWENYLEARPAASAETRYPEVTLSTVIGEHHLAARYDLIGVDADGGGLVFDWKTYRQRPGRRWLAERLQTRVYPYVLVRAWDAIDHDRPIRPDRVTMVYWFAEFPSVAVNFSYDADQFHADESYLQGLMEEIRGRVAGCAEDELLERTGDRERCRFCRYRSFCGRGVEPGRLGEGVEELASDDLSDFSLDFGQIAEFEVG